MSSSSKRAISDAQSTDVSTTEVEPAPKKAKNSKFPSPFTDILDRTSLTSLCKINSSTVETLPPDAIHLGAIFCLTRARVNITTPAAIYWLPPSGWEPGERRPDGSLVSIKAGEVTVSVESYKRALYMVEHQLMRSFRVGTDKLIAPDWNVSSVEPLIYVTHTHRSKGPSVKWSIGFLELLFRILKLYSKSGETLSEIPKLACAMWIMLTSEALQCEECLMRSMASLSTLDEIAEAALALTFDNSTPQGVTPVTSILFMTKVTKDPLLARWQTFKRLQSVLPLTSSQITIASTLQLRLPVSFDVMTNIKPKDPEGVLERVTLTKLKAEDLVLVSNKSAAGGQVIDFLKTPPEGVYVTKLATTAIVKHVPAKGKRAETYVDDGTFQSKGYDVIPGDEFAKLLGIVSTSQAKTVVTKKVSFPSTYTIDI